MKRVSVLSCLLIAFGCSGRDDGDIEGATGVSASGGQDGDTGDDANDGGDGQSFDVADGQGTAGDQGDEEGCTKVDFLFVIDNSNSMYDNQKNLLANYPAFMDSIEQTLEVEDFHVMVVDTDAFTTCGDECTYWFDEGPCVWHETPCGTTKEQAEARTECDETLGAGVVIPMGPNSSAAICEFEEGNRYMTAAEPDLSEAFSCAAQVGTGGNGKEAQIEAMLAAVGPQLTQPGGCNEGFLRDDALLVVTLLTDESGDAPEQFDVTLWRDELVAAKNGNEENVVMLGLLPDALPNGGGVCSGDNQAIATKFIEFVESLPNGSWASVCEDDYQPFFQDAVGVVDGACDDFIPPG
jgi:hypothetical protein